ncbi:SET domain-containing protein [Drepanopeziza brunnea f. sp. 'multigermtubi' MB_m1]|uniref:SET domain-containing protein n=1 Tax=Marssonina brunnea f. sp. multigermtubi (strain MB_m1) TaxID=1072389 RepID=K1XRG2_MARBU|nr:SET domain-containing protein [Drepanopeziza brunnea f. sp. 'multigermtubi' MB_m1]EKD15164.1 SET domain-containing protein [Drepanopeziza brunnea f. sp. 'multigermtubi' MB_m1]
MSSQGPAPPKNWPPGVRYLTTPVYSPTLTPSHLTALRTRPPQDAKEAAAAAAAPANPHPKGPCKLVRIAPVTTPSHPAHGQSGLFAARDLPPGTFLLAYLGEIHATPPPAGGDERGEAADPHADSDYDLSLDREMGIGIDAARSGTEARFINDYRGVADRPNAEFREVWDAGRGERGMGVWVLPEGKSGKGKGKGKGKSKGNGKGIRKGEEILVSYGRGFWGARREREEVTRILCSAAEIGSPLLRVATV